MYVFESQPHTEVPEVERTGVSNENRDNTKFRIVTDLIDISTTTSLLILFENQHCMNFER